MRWSNWGLTCCQPPELRHNRIPASYEQQTHRIHQAKRQLPPHVRSSLQSPNGGVRKLSTDLTWPNDQTKLRNDVQKYQYGEERIPSNSSWNVLTYRWTALRALKRRDRSWRIRQVPRHRSSSDLRSLEQDENWRQQQANSKDFNGLWYWLTKPTWWSTSPSEPWTPRCLSGSQQLSLLGTDQHRLRIKWKGLKRCFSHDLQIRWSSFHPQRWDPRLPNTPFQQALQRSKDYFRASRSWWRPHGLTVRV